MKNSLLELLHPDGSANTSVVLGSNCPANLLPEVTKATDQEIALLILAPTADECRYNAWLEEAANFASHHLAVDGVCYLLVPPRWRRKLIDLLARANLVADAYFWHFPNWMSSHYIVPLQPGPAQFAVDNFMARPSWKQMVARAVFRIPGTYNFLSVLWGPLGISLRRLGARPAFQWLFKSEQAIHPGTAIIRRSWRDIRGVNILYCFTDNDAAPSAIAKTTAGTNAQACLDHEAETLEKLGPGARKSGVQVPRILRKERNDHRSLLSLAPVRGTATADLLAANPSLCTELVSKIVDWLERWHVSTVSMQARGADQFEQHILLPLQRLVPMLRNAEEYTQWLSACVRSVTETPFPSVATHNDLTMANVLVDDHHDLGVIDWETGKAAGWPLVDFYYAVTDAIRISGGYSHRLDAFKACYQDDGIYQHEVQCWEKRLCSAAGLSRDMAVLCFHACWLHHAQNEYESSELGDPRPFFEIVQWLALNYSTLHENRN